MRYICNFQEIEVKWHMFREPFKTLVMLATKTRPAFTVFEVVAK